MEKTPTSLGRVEHSTFLVRRAIFGYTEILENKIAYVGNQCANRAIKKKKVPLYGLQQTSVSFESFLKDESSLIRASVWEL